MGVASIGVRMMNMAVSVSGTPTRRRWGEGGLTEPPAPAPHRPIVLQERIDDVACDPGIDSPGDGGEDGPPVCGSAWFLSSQGVRGRTSVSQARDITAKSASAATVDVAVDIRDDDVLEQEETCDAQDIYRVTHCERH